MMSTWALVYQNGVSTIVYASNVWDPHILVALSTHILQTADHRVCDSAHKYKHLPAKKISPRQFILQKNSEGLEHFESGSEVRTSTCSIQSQTAVIFISCAALANPPPPPWRNSFKHNSVYCHVTYRSVCYVAVRTIVLIVTLPTHNSTYQ